MIFSYQLCECALRDIYFPSKISRYRVVGARVIDSTVSSRKSTDSDDDIQSPLILRCE